MNLITAWMQRQRFSWREFLILVLIGALANIYFLSNFSPSIDDELAAVRVSGEVWIGQGRFTTYLVETLLFPQPSIPFSPYLFLAVMLALTQMLLVRAHGIAPSWRSHAAFCFFVTYPTWWMILEFSANVPATGVGFLLVAAALRLHADQPHEAPWRASRQAAYRLLAIGLLLALSAGAYQTMLLLFACGVIGITLCRSIESNASFSWARAFVQIFYGGVCLIAGAVMYFTLNKLAMAITGVPPEYIATFVNLENLRAPRWLVGSIALHAWTIYSGAAVAFGAAMPVAALAIACAAVAVVLARPRAALPNLILFGLLLGTPFLLHLLSGPNGLPLRTMVALPYVVWLCALLTMTYQRGAAWILSLAVFALFQLQIVNLTSQYVAAATITQQQDRFMGFEIARRIHQLGGETGAGTPVILDVYGYREQERLSLFAAAPLSVTRGSFFGWDKGNLSRITAYLRVLGLDRVEAAPAATRAALTEQFATMPAWPNEGALRRVGDVYLLKLGDLPDRAHAAVSGK